MAKKIKKTDSYKVGTANADVKVGVDVGLGQRGTTKITLSTTPLVTVGAPVSLTVGKGSDIKGKLLTIETLVTDVSTMTNKMSVAVKLTGGPSSKTITTPGEVTDSGDSVIFQTLVLFKE